MLNLAIILEDSARRYPDKMAFQFMDTALTFTQINVAANQVANGLLQQGIQPGDKVGLSCLNLPYFPIIYFGILKAGAVVVPLSVLLKQDEIAYHLSDSEAKAYFCFEGNEALPMGTEGKAGFDQVAGCQHFYLITARPTDPPSIPGVSTLGMLMKGQAPSIETAQTSAEDTAVIIYTSGTTGRPKGAELTHSNLLLNAILSGDLVQVDHNDVILTVLPLFHIFAMTVCMNSGIYRGGSNVLLPKFDADAVLKLMLKHKVTIFAGVPTMYWGLLMHDDPTIDIDQITKTLRICASGGAAIDITDAGTGTHSVNSIYRGIVVSSSVNLVVQANILVGDFDIGMYINGTTYSTVIANTFTGTFSSGRESHSATSVASSRAAVWSPRDVQPRSSLGVASGSQGMS